MKTIDEIRRDNLKILVKKHKSVAIVAELIGRSPSQVSQWQNGSADSKTGNARGIRAASCRHIEASLKLPDGWMDTPHDTTAVSVKSSIQVEEHREPYNVSGKNSIPHTGKAANTDAVTAEELVELVNSYVVASPKERKIILTSAKLAAKRAASKVTRSTND